MITTSRVLGELAKAQQGNAQTQEGDSRIVIPNVFTNIIDAPMSLVEVLSLATPVPARNQTTFFSTEFSYNVNAGGLALLQIGSGLWDITWRFSKRLAGAASDLTSQTQLTMILNDGTGPSANLAVLSNGQQIPESYQGEFSVTLPSPVSLQFNRFNVIGAGTGLNVAFVSIFARKRL